MRTVSLLFCLVFFATETLAQECPINEGEVVQIVSAPILWKSVRQNNILKGEYETTADFEMRVQNNRSASNIPFIVQAELDKSKIQYNADKGWFEIDSYAWHVPYAFWNEALAEGKKYALEFGKYGPYDNIGIKLKYARMFGDTHDAKNVYGSDVTVLDVTTKTYLIFDRRGTAKWRGEIDWAGDTGNDPAGIGKRIKLEIPIQKAKNIKDTINIGIVIQPKGIKKIKSSSKIEATLLEPYNIEATYNVVVADILCAVIVDIDSKVLKTVSIQYR